MQEARDTRSAAGPSARIFREDRDDLGSMPIASSSPLDTNSPEGKVVAELEVKHAARQAVLSG
jgi:hypothetical protein